MRSRLLLLLVLSFPANAFAYTLHETDQGVPVHWEESTVSFVIDASGSDWIDLDGAEDGLKAALATWSSVPGGDIRLSFGGRVEGEEVGYFDDQPNTNLVAFFDSGWPYGEDTLALTITTYSGSTGKLYDADIAVNTADTSWSTDGQDGDNDFISAITHEAGHALGLDHAVDVPDATMYPSMPEGELIKRTLSSDDVSGFLVLYSNEDALLAPSDEDLGAATTLSSGRTQSTSPAGTTSGPAGCSSAGPAPGANLVVWTAAVGLFFVSRRGLKSRFIKNFFTSSVALLSGLVVTTAHATTTTELTVAEMVERADLVIRGEVLSTESAWESGLIVTQVQVAVEECLLGDCPEVVALKTYGGQIGDIVQSVEGAPLYTPGDRVVSFLERAALDLVTVGLSQGQFLLVESGGQWLAQSPRTGLILVDSVSNLVRPAQAVSMPLDELVFAIRGAGISDEIPAEPVTE